MCVLQRVLHQILHNVVYNMYYTLHMYYTIQDAAGNCGDHVENRQQSQQRTEQIKMFSTVEIPRPKKLKLKLPTVSVSFTIFSHQGFSQDLLLWTAQLMFNEDIKRGQSISKLMQDNF